MSPVYCFKCNECGDRYESMMDYAEVGYFMQHSKCTQCGGSYRRDYSCENARSHYHPTVDLYANDLKRRAEKNRKMDRAAGWNG